MELLRAIVDGRRPKWAYFLTVDVPNPCCSKFTKLSTLGVKFFFFLNVKDEFRKYKHSTSFPAHFWDDLSLLDVITWGKRGSKSFVHVVGRGSLSLGCVFATGKILLLFGNKSNTCAYSWRAQFGSLWEEIHFKRLPSFLDSLDCKLHTWAAYSSIKGEIVTAGHTGIPEMQQIWRAKKGACRAKGVPLHRRLWTLCLEQCSSLEAHTFRDITVVSELECATPNQCIYMQGIRGWVVRF